MRTLNERVFNLLLGIFIGYGFLMNFITVYFFSDEIIQSIPFLGALIGYLILGILGVVIMKRSDNALLSFIGYNLLVVPLGITLAFILPSYGVDIIVRVCFVTFVCVCIMLILGTIFPQFFLGMGRVLFSSLLVCLVIEIILLFCGIHLTIFDWIAALIFCGYIGYDWAKINNDGIYTIDAAVDGAGALYLDIINLFLRLLDIMSDD